MDRATGESCQLCGDYPATEYEEGAFLWCWSWPACESCKPAVLHKGAYVLASGMGDERPYVEAFCHGRNCPVPDGMDRVSDVAIHISDYAEWRRWRARQGLSWKEQAKEQWWYRYVKSE